jgi:hypothetical protein
VDFNAAVVFGEGVAFVLGQRLLEAAPTLRARRRGDGYGLPKHVSTGHHLIVQVGLSCVSVSAWQPPIWFVPALEYPRCRVLLRVPMRRVRFVAGFELDEILMLTASVVLIGALVYII